MSEQIELKEVASLSRQILDEVEQVVVGKREALTLVCSPTAMSCSRTIRAWRRP